MMSFSVSERTREIGIRSALGAQRSQIVLTFLRRSLLQIGAGVVLGMPLAGMFFHAFEIGIGEAWRSYAVAFGTGAAVMVLIGLLSCLSPARRILKIQPAEALRAE